VAVSEIRVLIVDDSAVVRQVLTAVLDKDPRITVIGAAADPIYAMKRMNQEWPDVVVLDIEMPRMDGITFLKKLMSVRPTPVVVCSTLTEAGAQTTMQALAAGAVAVVTKPRAGLKGFLETDEGDLVHAVRAAAACDMRRARAVLTALRSADRASSGAGSTTHAEPVTHRAMSTTTDRIVAVGVSTGGTQALELVLPALPRTAPGVVIVQHMPEKFTAAFATRLNQLCLVEVLEAKHGDRVLPGRALVAPGGRHMTVRRDGAQYRVEILDAPPVNRHRPSVDVLFRAVADCAGANALGIIMTGMGDDGARGLKQMRDAGGRTLGQNEATCVVYGMPKVAMELGATQRELPLTSIAAAIIAFR
jgi:two-component system, chemotaxis family, protein-glutamate methylesterase/glutaminase